MKLSFLTSKIHASIIFLSLFLGLLFPQSAFADSFTLSGNISDSSGINISGSTIDITNSVTGANAGSVTTDNSGNYSLIILEGTYNVQVTPPIGSEFSPAIALNQNLSSDKILNFILTPIGTVLLNGQVYDPLGNPLRDQNIFIYNPSTNTNVATTSTDSNGKYLLQVTSGTYRLSIRKSNNDPNLNAPSEYSLNIDNFNLTQSTTLDITIPVKRTSVHVQDQFGNPINGAVISTTSNLVQVSDLSIGGGITNATGYSVYFPGSSTPITDASGNAVLWLFPNTSNEQQYTLVANPPNESSYGQASLSNLTISNNNTQIITLPESVTLNGHVHDPLGNPLPNQNIFIVDPATNTNATTTNTDSNGNYSVQAAPGTYKLSVRQSNNAPTINAPREYSINIENFSLTESKTLNITLPFNKITVHVQDSMGNPVNGIIISNSSNLVQVSDLNIGNNITNATGYSVYYPGSNTPVTDSSGNAVLWLLPNTSSEQQYTLIATPPNESIYSAFNLNNITVTSDQTELISLQYNHDTPLTTATLETKNQDETYTDPTTITLPAIPAEGYSISSTYYTIDGGTQQTYSSPFTISGSGEHTLTYWSEDNSGVRESPNTKTFTIQTNHPPVLDPISNQTTSEGQLLQFTLSANDPDGDDLTYSAANLPQGATFDTQTHTFSWTPGFNQEGNYENVEFTVTANGSPMELDTELITITVGNINRAPIFDPLGSQEILEGHLLTFTVNAIDPDGNEFTLAAENIPQGASFDPQIETFSWTPTHTQSGNYVLTFKATDNGTPSETGILEVAITVGDNPTPVEQAENLISTVINYNLPANIENSYLSNLKKIPTFIDQGKIQPAINQLNAFISKAKEDYANGTISQEIHDELIGLAQKLLDDLQ